MATDPRILPMIIDLWHRLSIRRRAQFVLLLALMIIASFAEIFSLGMVLPFLGVLTAPERVFSHPIARPFIDVVGIADSSQLIIAIAIGFCGAALIAGGIRLVVLYISTRYSYALGADISADVYRRTLYQPYSVHIARNSSEVISGITGKTAMLIGSILVPILTLVGSGILLVGIVGALLALDPLVTLIGGLSFCALYWLILRITRAQLVLDSEIISRESSLVVKSLQEGLGGIRDVLIDGTQDEFCRIYQASDRPLRLAQGRIALASGSPRYFVETLGMILIAVLAVVISRREGGVANAVPLLGALALGAQRLLPVLQQGYVSLTIMRGGAASLRDILGYLGQPLPATMSSTVRDRMPFEDSIALNRVGFRYGPQLPAVLSEVSLRIEKGQRVGFVGPTGGGKSTLLDIVMGLLSPTDGTLMVDGEALTSANRAAWQRHIAHVPQSIYLADSSIAENIAFGIHASLIDMDRVRNAASKAQIADVVEGWPKGYATVVGERGARLSGGQRQRIGVARALYKDADVIILDEATSALDNDTEHALMASIDGLGREITILIIAHRLTTIKDCDFVVELDKGRLNKIGSFDQLFNPE